MVKPNVVLETKKILPYAGIPVISCALLIVKWGRLDGYSLIASEVLVVFGYIAAVYDTREKRIPNKLLLMMFAAWALIVAPFLYYDTGAMLLVLGKSAGGFLTASVLFLLVYVISRKGLGGGDVKFMAVAGLYLGFRYVLPAMLFGSLSCAVTAGVLLLLKRIGRRDTIPLAPFLYFGILLTLFLY